MGVCAGGVNWQLGGQHSPAFQVLANAFRIHPLLLQMMLCQHRVSPEGLIRALAVAALVAQREKFLLWPSPLDQQAGDSCPAREAGAGTGQPCQGGCAESGAAGTHIRQAWAGEWVKGMSKGAMHHGHPSHSGHLKTPDSAHLGQHRCLIMLHSWNMKPIRG